MYPLIRPEEELSCTLESANVVLEVDHIVGSQGSNLEFCQYINAFLNIELPSRYHSMHV